MFLTTTEPKRSSWRTDRGARSRIRRERPRPVPAHRPTLYRPGRSRQHQSGRALDVSGNIKNTGALSIGATAQTGTAN